MKQTMKNRSDNLDKLATALSKAQGEMEFAKKDSENPYFKSKYADLASVWSACQEPLKNNGLSVTQTFDSSEIGVKIVTTLLHASGQWLSGELVIRPVKLDPQGIGSAITYGRRYSLAAIVGVIQDDDDAEAAQGRIDNNTMPGQRSNPIALNKSVDASGTNKSDSISTPQLKRLHAIASVNKWTPEQLKHTYTTLLKVQSAKSLSQKQYAWLVGKVENTDFDSLIKTYKEKMGI